MDVVHTYCSYAWEEVAQVLYKVGQTSLLFFCACICRITMFIETSFVADADTVIIVTFAVVTWLCEQVMLRKCAISSDIKVLRNVFVPF